MEAYQGCGVSFLTKTSKIFVAGHTGLIGTAFVDRLRRNGYSNVLMSASDELDLRDASRVNKFFEATKPEIVILSAGRVGGILANQTYPADFISHNLAITLNTIEAAHRSGVEKFVFFGTSCMYPKSCPQPMQESDLLTGMPEETSLPYAVAKLAGLQLCLAYNRQYAKSTFIPLIPNNVYGPHDLFDPMSSHVLPALMMRFHHAKMDNLDHVVLWGTGKPRREFVFVEDVVDATLTLLDENKKLEVPLNIGVGEDHSIAEVAALIAKIVGYRGAIEWDPSQPDGAPAKLLDTTKLDSLGWKPKYNLEEGLRRTYDWYLTCRNH